MIVALECKKMIGFNNSLPIEGFATHINLKIFSF